MNLRDRNLPLAELPDCCAAYQVVTSELVDQIRTGGPVERYDARGALAAALRLWIDHATEAHLVPCPHDQGETCAPG